METTLRQFGNSLGFVIPKGVRESMALSVGQTVQLEQTAQGLLIKPAKIRHSLDSLIARCDKQAVFPEDVRDWEQMQVTGNEAW